MMLTPRRIFSICTKGSICAVKLPTTGQATRAASARNRENEFICLPAQFLSLENTTIDVAHALMRAVSRLLSTPARKTGRRHECRRGTHECVRHAAYCATGPVADGGAGGAVSVAAAFFTGAVFFAVLRGAFAGAFLITAVLRGAFAGAFLITAFLTATFLVAG